MMGFLGFPLRGGLVVFLIVLFFVSSFSFTSSSIHQWKPRYTASPSVQVDVQVQLSSSPSPSSSPSISGPSSSSSSSELNSMDDIPCSVFQDRQFSLVGTCKKAMDCRPLVYLNNGECANRRHQCCISQKDLLLGSVRGQELIPATNIPPQIKELFHSQ